MSTNDVYVYIKAALVASLLTVAAVTFMYRFRDFSKGIFVIDWILTTGFLLATRGSFRLFIDTMKRRSLTGARVLLYGAGQGGEIVLREILNNRSLGMVPVGFVDDNPLKAGKRILGYPILGSFTDLAGGKIAPEVDGVLVTFIKKQAEALPSLAAFCSSRGLFLKRFTIVVKDVDPEDPVRR